MKYIFILIRSNAQNWLTFWSKENWGYESVIITVRHNKSALVVNWQLAEKLVVNWQLSTPISTSQYFYDAILC